MPNLLIVTPFFPPSAASGSFRSLGFAKHLPKFGVDVAVVASGPRPWELDDPQLLQEIPTTTKVHYVEFPIQKARRISHQIMQRLGVKECTSVWNEPTLKKCREVVAENRPDVIMTSGPPHNVHLIGRKLQDEFKLPWIADFRDPWCSWGQEIPYVNNSFLMDRYWERLVFTNADRIVANTTNTAEMFKGVFPRSANRIEAVANGYDPVYSPSTKCPKKNADCYVLLHTGVIYAGRDPRPVAEAVRALGKSANVNNKRIQLRLIGECSDHALAADVERGELKEWIELVPPVSYAAAAEQMQAADVLVLLDSPGRRVGVPAKLYEYIGAQKPILALARRDSDTAKVLQESGLPHRVIWDWQDLAGIQEAIVDILSTRVDRNLALPGNISLTRESQARRLSEILNSLA